MSTTPNDPNDPAMGSGASGDQPQSWEEMLRAVFGDATAEEVANTLKAQGIDPSSDLQGILGGKNFTLITKQVKDMLSNTGNQPVNWTMAEEVARETIRKQHMDRLTAAEGDAARTALRTSSLWLDVATDLDPAQTPSLAWNRLDFVSQALPTMKRLLNPVGANISRAFHDSFAAQLADMPESMRAMFPDPSQFMGGLTATMIGVQYGTALCTLAAGSFGSTDAGLPLMEGSSSALVPSNIADFAKDLEGIEVTEVMLYIATRENAAARLYSQVPWLRSRVLDTVAAFAQDIQIDTDSIEEQLRDSLQSSQSIQTIDLSSVFTLELTEHQQELLSRLEHLLSLVEGWISHVASMAVAPHLPHWVALQEMFTRRYATDNPAKAVWEAQLGMELAPRSLREAVAFWQMAYSRLGQEGRDALWAHPDLLPSAKHLQEPASFFEQKEPSDIEAELDSFLENLLNEADSTGSES